MTNLISSIIPEGKRVSSETITPLDPKSNPPSFQDSIKPKFIFNWDQRIKKNRRKKNKKRANDKLLKDLTLPRLGLSFADLIPVHNLWLQYMENVLGDHLGKPLPAVHDPGYENFSLLLMKADYNGAKVKVVRSKCSSLIGKSGILAMETKETLRILQENNQLISE